MKPNYINDITNGIYEVQPLYHKLNEPNYIKFEIDVETYNTYKLSCAKDVIELIHSKYDDKISFAVGKRWALIRVTDNTITDYIIWSER